MKIHIATLFDKYFTKKQTVNTLVYRPAVVATTQPKSKNEIQMNELLRTHIFDKVKEVLCQKVLTNPQNHTDICRNTRLDYYGLDLDDFDIAEWLTYLERATFLDLDDTKIDSFCIVNDVCNLIENKLKNADQEQKNKLLHAVSSCAMQNMMTPVVQVR